MRSPGEDEIHGLSASAPSRLGAGDTSCRCRTIRTGLRRDSMTTTWARDREQNARCRGSGAPRPSTPLPLSITTQGRLNIWSESAHHRARNKRQKDTRLLRGTARARIEPLLVRVSRQRDRRGRCVFHRSRHHRLQATDDGACHDGRLKQNFPPGVDYRIVYTRPYSSGVQRGPARALSKRSCWCDRRRFLPQTWRASIIPVAVPVSLVDTFAFMLVVCSRQHASAFGLVSIGSWGCAIVVV